MLMGVLEMMRVSENVVVGRMDQPVVTTKEKGFDTCLRSGNPFGKSYTEPAEFWEGRGAVRALLFFIPVIIYSKLKT